MRYINELREGDNVSEVYLCKVKKYCEDKSGKDLLFHDFAG